MGIMFSFIYLFSSFYISIPVPSSSLSALLSHPSISPKIFTHPIIPHYSTGRVMPSRRCQQSLLPKGQRHSSLDAHYVFSTPSPPLSFTYASLFPCFSSKYPPHPTGPTGSPGACTTHPSTPQQPLPLFVPLTITQKIA